MNHFVFLISYYRAYPVTMVTKVHVVPRAPLVSTENEDRPDHLDQRENA